MGLDVGGLINTYIVESKLGQGFLLATGLTIVFAVYNHVTYSVRVPAYGSHIPLLYQVGVVKFLRNGHAILADGYRKYGIFKIPQPDGWAVMTHGKYAEEFYRTPEEILSFEAQVEDSLQIPFTLGSAIGTDPWHIATIRGTMTRNLGTIFNDIKDEVEAGFEDAFQLQGNEWKTFNLYNVLLDIIARVSNRAFVGQPLCANKEWRDLNVRHTIDVVITSATLNLCPKWLQPIVGKLLTKISKTQQHAMKLLLPLLEERWKLPAEERPVDMLTWFMNEAPENERNDPYALTLRILAINFAAIHTTSSTLTQALHVLLAHRQYLEPLRDEAVQVTEEHGWSKTAMGHLHKSDSFFREVSRFWGLGSISSGRKVLQPFTFSDGTHLPVGTRVFTLARPMHRDSKVYEDGGEFKAFRWSEKRDEDLSGGKLMDASKNQLVATSLNYVPFGHGKHACPGRFFAANELKCLLSYLLINYDIEWAPEEKWAPGEIPPELNLGGNGVPNQSVNIRVRRRAAAPVSTIA